MWNARLDEAQIGIKIARRNNNLRYADDNYPNGRNRRGTKEPLDDGERGEWKSWLKIQHSSIWFYHFMANGWGKSGNSEIHLFSWAPKSLWMVIVVMKFQRCLLLGRKAMTNLDTVLKSRDITLTAKVCIVNTMVFPVVMYRCESWTTKAEHWRIDAFELWCWGRLSSPLDCKELQWVHPKGDQSWIFIGRTDAKAETVILWLPIVKSWLTGKDPDAGKDWRQEEKEGTEDEMVGWHHRLNGHEFEQAPADSEGEGSLACCSPWGQSWTQLNDWTPLPPIVC